MTEPIRAHSMRIARLDPDGTPAERWTEVGVVAGPVTFTPLLALPRLPTEEDVAAAGAALGRAVTEFAGGLGPALEQAGAAFREVQLQASRTATISIAFRPSKRLLRVVLGPRWAWDVSGHRRVTRAKYRARARRRSR